jgi:hypothetical protein
MTENKVIELQNQLAVALSERDAYFKESARVKETLADIIPALELASGLKADELRQTGVVLSGDEVAALWMARAILEAQNTESEEVKRMLCYEREIAAEHSARIMQLEKEKCCAGKAGRRDAAVF